MPLHKHHPVCRFIVAALQLSIFGFSSIEVVSGQTVRFYPNPGQEAQTEAFFGSSVAHNESFVAVGSKESTINSATGVVRVFSRSTGQLLHTLTHSDYRSDNTDFGTSLAFWNGRLLVGAPLGELGGKILVYDLGGATPATPTHEIKNPRKPGSIGWTMAVSGNRLVTGVRFGGDGVQVYDLAGAKPGRLVLAIPNPPNSDTGGFGSYLALSGNRLAVAEPSYNTGNMASIGRVFLYNLAGTTPSVPVRSILSPNPEELGNFGSSLSLEGTRLLVGASGEAAGNGRAYLYDLASPSSQPTIFNRPAGSASMGFGHGVKLSGSTAIISAPSLLNGTEGITYVYDTSAAAPSTPIKEIACPQPSSLAEFGSSLSLFGSTLAVGAPASDASAYHAGQVYLFDLAASGSATPLHSLFAPGPSSGDQFGGALAATSQWLIAGAPKADQAKGKIYVYERAAPEDSPPAFTLEASAPLLFNEFGAELAAEGSRVVVGSPSSRPDINQGTLRSGSATVFDLSSTDPQQNAIELTNPHTAVTAAFGRSVAVSGDRIAVGAPGAVTGGSVLLFDAGAPSPGTHYLEIPNPEPASGDDFGSEIVLTGDLLVVAAPRDDASFGDSGSVYCFDLSGASPELPVSILRHPTPAANRRFGTVLAWDDNKLVVTAPGTSGTAILIYDLTNPTQPSLIHSLPHDMNTGTLGHAIAFAGDKLLARRWFDSSSELNLFDLSSAAPGKIVARIPWHIEGALATAGSGLPFYLGDTGDDSVSNDRGRVVELPLAASWPPVVVLNTPRHLCTGNSLTLDASSSYQAADPVKTVMRSYQWDLDKDGRFTDAVGSTPTVSWKTLQGLGVSAPGNYRMAVKVTSLDGLVSVENFTVRVEDFRISSPLPGKTFKETASPAITVSGVVPRLHPMSMPVTVSLNGHPAMTIQVNESSVPMGGLMTWSTTIQPVPGTNVITATAGSGLNTLNAAPVSVFYEVRRTITLTAQSANGTFSIKPAPTGGKFILGKLYQITAKPKPGYLFDGWAGASTSLSPSVSITFNEGDSLTASFVPSPFQGGLPGTYAATLQGSTPGTRTQDNACLLELALARITGAFTGKVHLHGVAMPLTGTFFHRDFTYQSPVPNSGLSVALVLDHAASPPRITGSITRHLNGQPVAVMNVMAVKTHDKSTPVPVALGGPFNIGFDVASLVQPTPQLPVPSGRGYGVLTITRTTGRASMVGSLADGSSYTCSSWVLQDAIVPVYLNLPLKGSSVVGDLMFDPLNSEHDLSATGLRWYQAPQIGGGYTAGFGAEGLTINAVGARQVTSKVDLLSGFPSPLLVASGGSLAQPSVVQLFRRSTTQFHSADGNASLIFRPNGLATGSVLGSGMASSLQVRGIIVGKGSAGSFFGSALSPSGSVFGGGSESSLIELFAP